MFKRFSAFFNRCHRDCVALRFLHTAVLFVILDAILLLLVLAFGPIESSKYIWWFQSNVWSWRNDESWPPENYTASFNNWCNGLSRPPSHFYEYANGKRNGLLVFYWPNGLVFIFETYKNGILDGLTGQYESTGEQLSQGVYKCGKKWDGTFMQCNARKRETYQGGELIKTEDVPPSRLYEVFANDESTK
mgnify:CR=1 FL=1